MDIIERYLEAVAAQLSAAEREDIIAELRDLILSRVEAKEEELGRALDDAEKEAILHEIGHPLVVAARYRKGPDRLIGPELFPYWLFGMKAGLIIIAAVQALGLIFNVLGDPSSFGQSIGRAIQGFISSGLTVAGVLTLTGAIMEHYGMKPSWLTKWRVSDLPAFGLADPAAWGAALGGSEKSKADWLPKGGKVWGMTMTSNNVMSNALWSLIGGGLFVLWWIGALRFPGWGDFVLRDGNVDILAAPIWAVLFAPILAWACAGIAVDAITLMRPGAARLAAFLKVPVAAAGLWIGWRLFQADHWFTLKQGEETARIGGDVAILNFDALGRIHDAGSGLAATATTLGTVLNWVLAAIMIGLVVDILTQMWRISTMKDC